jgi:hypothetical protein
MIAQTLRESMISYFRLNNCRKPNASIPLYLIRRIRSFPKYGKTAFEIDAVSRKFVFRAETEEIMSEWLFSFQCSIALHLDRFVDSNIRRKRLKILNLNRWWKKADNLEKILLSSSIPPLCPITSSLHTYQHGTKSLSVAHSSTIGHRPSMEDAECIQVDADCAFFGVFDGHGGSEASEFSAQNLIQYLKADSNSTSSDPSQIKKCILDAFLKTDQEFIKMAEKEELFAGSTAICAYLLKDKLYIANCGDSRAVLCRKGKAHALSIDQKPNRDDERIRIENAGGHITTQKEINISQLYKLSPEFIDEVILQFKD